GGTPAKVGSGRAFAGGGRPRPPPSSPPDIIYKRHEAAAPALKRDTTTISGTLCGLNSHSPPWLRSRAPLRTLATPVASTTRRERRLILGRAPTATSFARLVTEIMSLCLTARRTAGPKRGCM